MSKPSRIRWLKICSLSNSWIANAFISRNSAFDNHLMEQYKAMLSQTYHLNTDCTTGCEVNWGPSTGGFSSTVYLIFTWYCVSVITFNPRVVLLHTHIPSALSSRHTQWSECLSRVTRSRHSVPLVWLGGRHVCAVTRPDLPKPARPPSRPPASTRPKTQECRERRALGAESCEETHIHLGST